MNLTKIYYVSIVCLFVYRNRFIYSADNLTGTTGTDSSQSAGSPSSDQIGTQGGNESTTSDPTKPEVKLVDINLNENRAFTYEYECQGSGSTKKYTANKNCGFKSVREGEIIIWKAENDDKYATELVLQNNTLTVLVGTDQVVINKGSAEWPEGVSTGCCSWKCLFTCGFYNCVCHGSAWSPNDQTFSSVDNSNKTPFVLYLDQEKSDGNYEYTLEKDGKTKTYAAKKDKAISEVILLTNNVHFGRADRKIWRTYEKECYASKVVMVRLGSYKINLTIETFNGAKLTFHRPAWGSRFSYKGLEKPPENKTNEQGAKTTPTSSPSVTSS